MAVLKRTNLLVNAGKLLLFRKASADHTKVPCLCMQNAVDYLKPEAQRKYMEYRDGKLQMSASFQEDLKWEARYIDAIMEGGTPPLLRANINWGPLHSMFRGSEEIPAASSHEGPMAKVKAEPVVFRHNLAAFSSISVDLCSPPKKKIRAGEPTTAPARVPGLRFVDTELCAWFLLGPDEPLSKCLKPRPPRMNSKRVNV